jgi:hypothetical protein
VKEKQGQVHDKAGIDASQYRIRKKNKFYALATVLGRGRQMQNKLNQLLWALERYWHHTFVFTTSKST